MRFISCITFTFSLLAWNCICQFTDQEIRSLRRRASDAGFSSSDLELLNMRISESVALRSELLTLKWKGPQESEKGAMNRLAAQLRQNYRELVAWSNPLVNQMGTTAAERAIERQRVRRALKQAAEEKVQQEKEQQNYVVNLKKLRLVEESIRSLRSRGEAYELSEQHMNRLDDLLTSYKVAEANRIFNNTSVKDVRDLRLTIDKFISHHQGVALTNRRRQEDMLDKAIGDLAQRAANSQEGDLVICPQELRELDSMLGTYRELSLRVIRQQHLDGSPSPEARRAAQTTKMEIEKFIGLHKKQARCVVDKGSMDFGSHRTPPLE